MRKVTTTVAAALVAFSFAACNKTNNSVTPEEGGNTFGKVIVEENATNRDVTDGEKNDVSGQGGESAVISGKLYTGTATDLPTLTDLHFTAAGGVESKWETKPFLYAGVTGQDILAGLVLNGTFGVDEFGADKEVGIDKLAELTKKEGFAMSSVATQKINIKPGVARDDVAADNNEFSFDVERITAKVQASRAATINQNDKLKGTFSDLRYAVAGSAKTSYIFRDHAGERDMKADAKYDNFTSAIHTLAGTTFKQEEGKKVIDVARDLQTVSDKSLTTLATDDKWGKYNSLELKEDADYKTASNAQGIYFLENSFDKVPTAARQLLYNDIVYVKVYATYAPADNEVLKLDADGKTLVGATAAEVTANENGTFFRGNVKNKLYLDAKAAKADGNSKAYRYNKGRMYWRVPANKQNLGKDFTSYADTRRNNIYSLQVTDILELGGNYDPIDPKDPNIPAPGEKDGDDNPTPKNPDEPTPDPEDPVDESENYMKVNVQVLQYNLVHRGLKLSRD